MGRPLAKRFFASGAGATIGCNFHDGSSVVESAIISQKSNSKYRVAGGGGTPLTGTSLIFADDNPDTITDNGASWADFTLTFSAGDQVRVADSESNANDGVYTIAVVIADVITLTGNVALVANADDTTATLALVAPNGVIATLVQGAPSAGEMQVVVTPEDIVSTVQATVTITSAGGTGALETVVIANAGAGYWVNATGADIDGGNGTINYTVDGNGSLASVSIATVGSANTAGTDDITDAPAAAPPAQSARIINAHTVKTFEGNIYDWPPTGGDGPGPSGRRQASLQTSDL